MSLINIKNFIIEKTLKWIDGQKTMTIQLDITNACNLTCNHCYHSDHKNNGALTLSQWKEVILDYKKLIEQLKLEPNFILCGGEPTISPFFVEIINYIDSIWPRVSVFVLTNGTRINQNLIDKIKPYNVTFQISLDGPDIDSNDIIRGPGSFEKAVAGIRLLRKNNLNVVIQSVLSKSTSFLIEDYFALAKSLNAKSMNFVRMIPLGYGKKYIENKNDEILLGLELKKAFELIYFNSIKYNVKTNTQQPLFCLIDENIGTNGKYGFQGIIFDYKGNLKISSRIDYIIGNVLNKNLSEMFLKNETLKNLRSGNVEKCGACKYYSRCGGDRNTSYAFTGSFLKADAGCWL